MNLSYNLSLSAYWLIGFYGLFMLPYGYFVARVMTKRHFCRYSAGLTAGMWTKTISLLFLALHTDNEVFSPESGSMDMLVEATFSVCDCVWVGMMLDSGFVVMRIFMSLPEFHFHLRRQVFIILWALLMDIGRSTLTARPMLLWSHVSPHSEQAASSVWLARLDLEQGLLLLGPIMYHLLVVFFYRRNAKNQKHTPHVSRWRSRTWALSDQDLIDARAASLEYSKQASESWWTSHPLWHLPQLVLNTLSFLFKTGPHWLSTLFRLISFVVVLAPAWPSLVRYYLSNPLLIRNIRYGPHDRNFLDIYSPFPNMQVAKATGSGGKNKRGGSEFSKTPVVVMVTGGAWIIGYKAWFTLLGNNPDMDIAHVIFTLMITLITQIIIIIIIYIYIAYYVNPLTLYLCIYVALYMYVCMYLSIFSCLEILMLVLLMLMMMMMMICIKYIYIQVNTFRKLA